MIATPKRLRQESTKWCVGGFAVLSFSAAVMAAPIFVPRALMVTEGAAALQPLANGPAIQLAAASGADREDCVRVTHITGPDGKDYPTRGMVCGGAQ